MFQAEYEAKLNRAYLHIYVPGHYEEDYQMPMLRQNPIPGVLEVEGCEVQGKIRYTYEIGGMLSMKTMYEKTWMKNQEILRVVTQLLEVTETLQKYMLVPGCLILKPEYIFYKEGRWNFCYLPGMEEEIEKEVHTLTEYFVKTLDYEDVEGIFLAYELHKATLQENYSLDQILKEYKIHRIKREQCTEEQKKPPEDLEEDKLQSTENETTPAADVLYEKKYWWKPWKKAVKRICRRRWGSWDDLILETDGQGQSPVV